MSSVKAAVKRVWNAVPLVTYADEEDAARLRDFYRVDPLGTSQGNLLRAGGGEKEEHGRKLLVLYSYGPGWMGQLASFDVDCLKWQAILAFCGVQFETRIWNEPLLSPKGELPILVAYDRSILVPPFATLQLPVENGRNSGSRKFGDLMRETDDVTQDIAAFLALVETKLHIAVMYHFWCEPENFSAVTEPAYGRIYAWPLNKLIMWHRRSQVIKAILAKRPTLIRDEIYEEAAEALQSLTERLGQDEYFSGTSTPSSVDAAVFAYLHTAMASPAPERELCNLLLRFPRLVDFSKRVYNKWFSNPATAAPGKAGGQR